MIGRKTSAEPSHLASATAAVAVTPERRSLSAPSFTWLTKYGELNRALLRRELRARYKGATLGMIWSYVAPLMMMGVYVLVFSVLWRVVTIEHYPLWVLTGLAVWVFFQAAVQTGISSLPANAPLMKKVWFPREIPPAVVVLSQLVTLGVMLAVIVPINLLVVPAAAKTALLAVPFLAAFVLLVLGITWLLATVNVFFRDVEHLVTAILLPWFFLTPVLYSLEQLPGAADRPWLIDLLRYGNPVTPYVESIRGALLQGVVVGPGMLAYVLLAGPIAFLVGLAVIQRFEDSFAVEL
jgi:lipopolysaccharide transport system permease protein